MNTTFSSWFWRWKCRLDCWCVVTVWQCDSPVWAPGHQEQLLLLGGISCSLALVLVLKVIQAVSSNIKLTNCNVYQAKSTCTPSHQLSAGRWENRRIWHHAHLVGKSNWNKLIAEIFGLFELTNGLHSDGLLLFDIENDISEQRKY